MTTPVKDQSTHPLMQVRGIGTFPFRVVAAVSTGQSLHRYLCAYCYVPRSVAARRRRRNLGRDPLRTLPQACAPQTMAGRAAIR